VTDAASATTLSLPMFPGLTDEEQAQVIDAVRAAVTRHAAGGTGGSPAELEVTPR
jgi:hypothetical protein